MANQRATDLAPVDLVRNRLPAMLAAIPDTSAMARKRFQAAALAIAQAPGISDCEPNSVYSAIFACARLNLIVDPVLHHASIVPFRDNRKGTRVATLIIEYRGLVELMRRANPTLSIKAGTVYENDVYTVMEGTIDKLEITERAKNMGLDPGKAVFHYGVAREVGKEPTMVIVPAIEAAAIGAKSKAGNGIGTPWGDFPDQMGEKTAIRRLSRFVAMDPVKEETKRFQTALAMDDRTDEMTFGDVVDVDAPPPPEPRKPVANKVTPEEPEPVKDSDLATKAQREGIKVLLDEKISLAVDSVTDQHRIEVMAIVAGIEEEEVADAVKGALRGHIKTWRALLKTFDADKMKAILGVEHEEGTPV
jgi:phage RecT family recombinase